MKKIIAMLMTLSLLVTCAACGGKDDTAQSETETAGSTAASTEESTQADTEGESDGSQAVSDSTMISFNLSYGENYDNMTMISAFEDYNTGNLYVEYAGAERKVTDMDKSVMEEIAAELEKSGLAALNGQNVYEDGEANAYFSAEYADGSVVTASYSGTIAQEFIDGFNAMDTYFQELLADVPVYVPEPMIIGEVDETVLAELQGILKESGIEPLDSLAITDVPMDEYFTFSLGLNSSEGILNGTTAASMNMSVAYSIAVVTVEDAANITAVAEDFESSMNWQKWVCVMPSNALIAQKDNMVLCLMGAEGMYDQTASAIEAAGWTTIQALTNPDM